MIRFFRYLFGYGSDSGNRKVVGAPPAPDAQEAVYVRASDKRLGTLQHLYQQYKATPHAEQIKAVLDKTKQIHHYLLSNKRVHELELFHVQHTDHFINTFSVIYTVYKRHHTPVAPADAAPVPTAAGAPQPPPRNQRPVQQTTRPVPKPQPLEKQFEEKVEDVLRRIETEAEKGIRTAHKVTEMVKRVANKAPYAPPADTLHHSPPTMVVATIAIDTYSVIYYSKEEEGAAGKVSGQISYTSTEEEKQHFISHIAAKLGIAERLLTYIGNTVLATKGKQGQLLYAPVLHWNNCAYAINLQDYRLFPVNTYRARH